MAGERSLERLQFKDYEELVCDISDTLDSIDDGYGEVSIIAKYDGAKEIMKELLCIGYDIISIELHREEFEEYWDEYILTLSREGIWCEKFKRDNGYLTDESDVTYIMDSCSSAVIPHCKGKNVYEVSVGTTDEDKECAREKHVYMVNGKSVDRETFNDLISKFLSDKAIGTNDRSDNSDYSISVKCDFDASEALKIIQDMEHRMEHMNDMFHEMDNFRRLFNW